MTRPYYTPRVPPSFRTPTAPGTTGPSVPGTSGRGPGEEFHGNRPGAPGNTGEGPNRRGEHPGRHEEHNEPGYEDHGHGHGHDEDHEHHHSAFFLNGFLFFGPGLYDPFYYYGYQPYVYPEEVVVVTPPAYTYSTVPSYYYGNDYYLNPTYRSGLGAALDDIRIAWLNDDSTLFQRHIDDNIRVDVYLGGKYAYSINGPDYRAMMSDAIGRIRTNGFTFNKLESRSDGSYVAVGRHDFIDANGNQRSVYISYTLRPVNGNWVIVAAGSSDTPLG